MKKFIFPLILIIYGSLHLISLKVKYPERFASFLRTNRIPALFVFLPEKMQKMTGAMIIETGSITVSIWIAFI